MSGAKRIVIFGYGNEDRADDAVGPLMLRAIEAEKLANVTCIEDYQLQIEHALDMKGADLVLFLDAGTGTPSPFAFYEAKPGGQFAASTHALAPEAVLSVYEKTQDAPAPPAFVLCVRGEVFELGAEMSVAARARMAGAMAFVQALLLSPEVPIWRARITCAHL